MQRLRSLRSSGSSIIGHLSVPQLRKKVSNSVSAVQDTFFSTKEIFESHKVVFTISTSLASILTAWGGYTLRHIHESRVTERLDSIEKSMKSNYHIEHSDFKKLVSSGSSNAAAYVATAGTSLIIGYGLGWRGGKWYANRKFRREQMKLLGQIKPKRWQLKFLRRPLTRPRLGGSTVTVSEGLQKDATVANNPWLLSFPSARKESSILLQGTKPRIMASSLASVILVILFCGSAVGTRTQLFSTKVQDGATLGDDDGICKLMVETKDYVCQEHTVTTRDGYILSLQRIPVGRSGGTPGDRTPVLLQHGLLMDGITWLLNPRDQSLALILADNGFDVWIASTRGTKYSRGHTSLSPDDDAYWGWSWDELVAYDLPATFQYVHDQTGQKLHYVGHSLGTLIALASFSRGQLFDMLRSAALLSPIAYVGQMTSPLARTAADNFLAEFLYWSGLHEFDPRGKAAIKLLQTICKKPGVNCADLLTSFTGQNCCLKSSVIDVFLEHEPQATSTKTLIHIAQMIRDGTITMYDYNDEDENRKHYGQPTPPVYDMTNIPNDLPLFLSYGGADALSDVNDVKLLLDNLKDHEGDKLVVHYTDNYAHADYVMGANAKQAVYDPLMAFFKLQ
ncbi:triacylglycerol lipase 2-like [Cornus florida]|uniref:triacylglycerol lipase 2-like n=1 Tax=Cornus florida TaxID=4283 RepID=UPI00289FE8C1|nr:triacylglycerol lipase 2-like [Cornus florida]